jgi:hypothetical protein
MSCMSTLLAVLLVVGSLAALPLYADEGGDGDGAYSERPAVANGSVVLAD